MNEEFDLFDLDDNRLDVEWREQARTFYRYALKLADAKAEHERTKARRDVVAADLHKRIASDPVRYDLPKSTVDAIKNEVLRHPKHIRATERVIAAKHNVDMLQAMVDALEHRKKALENRVQLYALQWRASPKIRGGNSEGARELERDINLRRRNKK